MFLSICITWVDNQTSYDSTIDYLNPVLLEKFKLNLFQLLHIWLERFLISFETV